MRNLNELNEFRVTDPDRLAHWGGWAGDETCGFFVVPSCIDRAPLRVIASNGDGWDHVSVSRKTRCPNWEEMEQVAALFFTEHETAMQLHVPRSQHLNLHPYCLHWWRPHAHIIPTPPSSMVAVLGGIKENMDYLNNLKK